MERRGLSSVVTGMLVMIVGMVLATTFAVVFFPFLNKATESAPPNECLSVQLAVTECISNETATSLRVARRSGSGNLTGVSFLFSNESVRRTIENKVVSFDEFESQSFIFPNTEITRPDSVDLAPILDPHRVCAPYHVPVTCSYTLGDIQTSQTCQFLTADWFKEATAVPSIVGLGDNLTLTLSTINCIGSGVQFNIEKNQGTSWVPVSPSTTVSASGNTYEFNWSANPAGEYRFVATSLTNNSITLTSRTITVSVLTNLACSNGIDDDGDGRVDGNDRGCLSEDTVYVPSDRDETDPRLCGYLWNVVGSSSAQIPIGNYPSIQSSGLFKVGLLNQGYFGTYPYYIGNTEYNGGIPQRVNITEHLRIAEQYINSEFEFSDPNWTGYMVIDYESWHPLWEWNYVWQNWKYINESIDYYRANHDTSGMSYSQIEAAAGAEFNNATIRLWNETINLGKRLRPRAVWGFYGYPIVPHYNAATPVCPQLPGEPIIGINACRKGLNNQLDWLTRSSDALYPDIYQQLWVNSSLSGSAWWPGQIQVGDNIAIVGTIVNESIRVANRVGGRTVAPYISLTFVSTDFPGNHNLQLIYNSYNFNHSYYYPLELGVDGLIIWNSVTDSQTATEYSGYLQNVAGPQTQYGIDNYC